MSEFTLHGSGGYITAELTDEQAKKADLGVGKLFLAPIGKVDQAKMSGYYCKSCEKNFDDPPTINVEASPDEDVAENLILLERGQYICHRCKGIIGEYRVFQKRNDADDTGMAKPGA